MVVNKVFYSYKNKSYDGKVRIMLHSAAVMEIMEEGQFMYVFSIHSDIFHF